MNTILLGLEKNIVDMMDKSVLVQLWCRPSVKVGPGGKGVSGHIPFYIWIGWFPLTHKIGVVVGVCVCGRGGSF